MKILIALCALLAVSTAAVIITAEHPLLPHALGLNKCSWGPSYWCANITTSAHCNVTRKCIDTQWKDLQVSEDNDDICSICKNMVQQARDQLESNETQQDIKAVLDGSCRLIHIKPIVKECISIVDQYIPDLIETLSSQMNPTAVCSVAGLCNSHHMDKLIEEFKQTPSTMGDMVSSSLEKDELEPDECSKCYTIATHMENKLSNTSPDKMLQRMLYICGELGSFSDACSATIMTYFDTIYDRLQKGFNAENICHLSGQCTAKFHKHDDKTIKVEITPLSSVGMVDLSDDLPCKLCEQLVKHLRDILIANTTEIEFQKVLEGICKQTKSFSSECTAIVDEYYPEIYNFLTNDLDSNMVCQLSGICPAPGIEKQSGPIWPLMPQALAEVASNTFKKQNKNVDLEKSEELSKSEVEAMQLPIERMLPFPLSESPLKLTGKESCALCEYVLHYLQQVITNPATEDEIKQAIGKVCEKLPQSIEGECSEFIDTYGDAVVATLAQEIDPSQVCPMLHVCPSEKLMEFWKSIPKDYMLKNVQDKPGCPLCLLAVSQVYNTIKNNKTEANIEAALDKLCLHLPQDLNDECVNLVKGYSKELIDLLLADLTPQEVCVYLKLCDSTKNPDPRNLFITDKDGEILTNEIPDMVPSTTQVKKIKDVPCVVCEFVMEHVDKAIGNDKARHKVEKAVHSVCNHLPKTISKECNNFVDKYADTVIDLITRDISPEEVCTMMGLCTVSEVTRQASLGKCLACDAVALALKGLLSSSKVDHGIQDAIHNVCQHVPSKYRSKCDQIITSHAPSIIQYVKEHGTTTGLCRKIHLCSDLKSVALPEDTEVEERSFVSATECVVCKSVIQSLRSLLSDPKVNGNIVNAVSKVCNHVPAKFHDKCNKMIQSYGPSLINYITQHGVVETACVKIALCSQSKFSLIFSEDTTMKERGVTECVVCDAVALALKGLLSISKVDHGIQDAIHNVCQHVPSKYRSKCDQLITSHAPSIIQYVKEHGTTTGLCRKIHLCSDLKSVALPEDTEVEERSFVSATECVVCKSVIQSLRSLLSDPKVNGNIVNAVSKVCNHVPAKFHDKCNKMIQSYGPSLINYITQHGVVETACVKIALCSQSKFSLIFSEDTAMEERGVTECVVCDAVAIALKKLLGSSKVDHDIENAVHYVCQHVPSKYRSKCDKLVTSHTPSIIDYVKRHGTTTLCFGILSCPLWKSAALPESTEIEQSSDCSVCRAITFGLLDIVGEPGIDGDIDDALAKVCNHIELKYQSKCKQLIQSYGSSILNSCCSKSAVSLENSRMKRSYEKGRIMKHCTWGPAYFCSTNEAAEECKAVEYCRENIWKTESKRDNLRGQLYIER